MPASPRACPFFCPRVKNGFDGTVKSPISALRLSCVLGGPLEARQGPGGRFLLYGAPGAFIPWRMSICCQPCFDQVQGLGLLQRPLRRRQLLAVRIPGEALDDHAAGQAFEHVANQIGVFIAGSDSGSGPSCAMFPSECRG